MIEFPINFFDDFSDESDIESKIGLVRVPGPPAYYKLESPYGIGTLVSKSHIIPKDITKVLIGFTARDLNDNIQIYATIDGSTWVNAIKPPVPPLYSAHNFFAFADLSAQTGTSLKLKAVISDFDDRLYVWQASYIDRISEWQKPVLDKDLLSPPPSPDKMDRYLINGVGGGAWLGQGYNIATWTGLIWIFTKRKEGMTLWVNDENKYYRYNGTNWGAADMHVPDTDQFLDFGGPNEVSAEDLRLHLDDVEIHRIINYDPAYECFLITG